MCKVTRANHDVSTSVSSATTEAAAAAAAAAAEGVGRFREGVERPKGMGGVGAK